MTEREKCSGTLPRDESLAGRVLQREPSLVRRIVSHACVLEALFWQAPTFRSLMWWPLAAEGFQFDQLVTSVGSDGASLPAVERRRAGRLLAEEATPRGQAQLGMLC